MDKLIVTQSNETRRRNRNLNHKGMAYCSGCDSEKLTSEFSKDSGTPRGIKSRCKECRKQEYQANKQQAAKAMRRRNLRVKFDISNAEYIELSHAQGDVCAACGQPETRIINGILLPLSIDHDHATGKIRGLLCQACNLGLGYFRDNIENLSNAIDYLMETHK